MLNNKTTTRPSGVLPSFWLMQIACWSVYCLVLYLTFLPFVAQEGGHVTVLVFKAYRSICGFLLSGFLGVFYRRIFESGGGQALILRSVFAASIGSLIFGCVWAAAEKFYWWMFRPDFDYLHAIATFPRTVLFYSITLFAWSAFYFGIKYWSNLRTQEEQLLRAQLEMLRYQLNPHFLFNALNSIRASIDEDASRAKGMITSLSEFLRFSLLNENEKKIPLRSELEAVRSYLDIEKIRFEDKLSVEFDIEPKAEEFKVPAFLLNPLVENAVTHGMGSSGELLRLKIVARSDGANLDLTVLNSGKFRNGNGTGRNGIGLKNVSKRLEKLFGPKGKLKLEQDGEFVRAAIEIKE